MREPQDERVVRDGDEQAQLLDGRETVQAGLDVEPGDAGEQAQVDLPPDEGGGLQQVARVVAEVGDAVADDVPDGDRHGRPDVGVVVDAPFGGQQPRQLPDEERISGGTGVDDPGDALPRIAAGLAADELGHLDGPERAEADPAVAGDPAGRGEQPGQLEPGAGARSRSTPMVAASPGALAARWPNSRREARSAHWRSSMTRITGCVVETSRTSATTRSNRRNWLPASGSAGSGAAPCGDSKRWPISLLEPPSAPVRRQGVQDRADGPHPGPHRRGAALFQAVAPHDPRAAPTGLAGRLLDQSRLAHSRLALHQDEPGAAAEGGPHRPAQHREVLGAADQSAARRSGHGGRSRGSARGPLAGLPQRRAGVEAEFLDQPGADLLIDRQRPSAGRPAAVKTETRAAWTGSCSGPIEAARRRGGRTRFGRSRDRARSAAAVQAVKNSPSSAANFWPRPPVRGPSPRWPGRATVRGPRRRNRAPPHDAARPRRSRPR